MSRRDSGTRYSARAARLHRAVLGGAAMGVALHSVHLVVRFALAPFVIARAGLEAYGLWSLVFVAFGALGLHRCGLVGALGSVVAERVAAKDIRGALRVLRSGAVLATLLSAAVLLVVGWRADWIVGFLGTEPHLAPTAALLFRLIALATAIQLMATPLHAALEAMQRHSYLRAAEIGSALFEAGLVFGLLLLAPGPDGGGDTAVLVLGVSFTVRACTLAMLHWRALGRTTRGRALRTVTPIPSAYGLRAIVPYAGTLQLLGSLHMAILAVPRVVVGWTLGLASVGAFEAGRKLVELVASLPHPALTPIAPAAAALTAGDKDTASDVARTHAPLRATTRYVAGTSALLLAALFACAEPLAFAWLGVTSRETVLTIQLLAPTAALHLATGPATAVLRGVRRPGDELRYCVFWLLCQGALVSVGATQGIAGALTGVAASQAIVCAWLLARSSRSLGLGRWTLLAESARGLAVGGASAAAGLTASMNMPPITTRLAAASQVVSIGTCAALGGALAASLFLFTREERDTVLRKLRGVRTSWA